MAWEDKTHPQVTLMQGTMPGTQRFIYVSPLVISACLGTQDNRTWIIVGGKGIPPLAKMLGNLGK